MAETEAQKKKEEERKKGAIPLGWDKGGQALSQLAKGGCGFPGGSVAAGHAGGAAVVLSKAGILILMTTLGIGAWGVGQYLRPNAVPAGPRAAVGESRDAKPSYDVDAASLPSDYRRGSGLMVVPESLGQAADAQAQASADAARTGAGDPAAAEPQAPDAKGGAIDAAAAAAAAAGEEADKARKGPFANKFGTLTALGSGKGSSTALNGGAGNFGGVGRTFGQKLGGAKGFGSTRSPGRATARIPRGTPGKRAFKQLQNASAMSRAGASAATGETAVAAADRAFSNNPGANSVVTGAGAGANGTTGVGSGGSAPTVNPGGTGPTNGYENTGGGGTTAPPIARGRDVSPWRMAAMAGGAALLIAGVLLMASAIMANMAKASGIAPPVALSYISAAKMLAMAALAMGVIATICGVMIMGMGQTKYGMIMTGGGALISVLAFMAMQGNQTVEQRLQVETKLATADASHIIPGSDGTFKPMNIDGVNYTYQGPAGEGAVWSGSNGQTVTIGGDGAGTGVWTNTQLGPNVHGPNLPANPTNTWGAPVGSGTPVQPILPTPHGS